MDALDSLNLVPRSVSSGIFIHDGPNDGPLRYNSVRIWSRHLYGSPPDPPNSVCRRHSLHYGLHWDDWLLSYRRMGNLRCILHDNHHDNHGGISGDPTA